MSVQYTSIRRDVVLVAAPFLFLAGMICVLLGVLEMGFNGPVFGLLGAMLVVSGAQCGAIWIVSSRIKERVEDTLKNVTTANELFSAFPVEVTLHAGMVSVLLGPISLIIASSVLGLGPAFLIKKCGIMFLLLQFSFLFLVFVIIRTNLRNSLRQIRIERLGVVGTRFSANLLIPLLILPTFVGAIAMWSISERMVRSQTHILETNAYNDIAGAIFTSDSHKSKTETISHLTSFDRATAFAIQIEDSTLSGIDGADASRIIQRLSNGDDFIIDEEFDVGLTWVALESTNAPDDVPKAIGGVKIQFGSSEISGYLMMTALMAAVLLVGALAMWYETRMYASIDYLVRRIDALPDKKPLQSPPSLPLELIEVDMELDRLKKRFDEMRLAQRDAIETGKEGREMKAQFFAGMSHDLRSPLNSIIGFADLLLGGIEGEITHHQREAIQSISKESERLMTLVANILDASKLDAGRFEIDKSWVHSVEIINECTFEASRLASAKTVELFTEIQPGLPPVFVDRARVRQALISLLSRTISSAKQGIIRVKASVEQNLDETRNLKIDIVDPVRAISLEERGRILEAFESVLSFRSSTTAGLGLGIALSRDIVQLHGGQLLVLEGEGSSIFCVKLPLDELSSNE